MASLFRRGKVWYVGFTVDGARVEKTTGETIKSRALVKAVEIETEYRSGKPSVGKRIIEGLEEYLADLQRQGRTPQYQQHIRRNLGYLEGVEQLEEIDQELIRQTLVRMKDKAPRTLNLWLTHLRSFLSYCVDRDWILENPALRIKKGSHQAQRPKRAFRPEEWHQFTETLRQRQDYQDHAQQRLRTYRVLVLSGLRVGEAEGLTPADFTLDPKPLWHLRPGLTKVRRRDSIPMLPECAELLRTPGPAGRVLWPIDAATFERDLHRAGLPKVNAEGKMLSRHSLLYTFCLNLALKGVPIQLVKRLMRHRSITLTADLYGELGLEDLLDQVEELPRLGL